MSGGLSIGPAAPSTSTLMELLASSESVQERILAYQKAKAEAESAFEALRIGQDAKRAYDDATAKHREAEDHLAKAQKHAAGALDTVAGAERDAKKIRDGAEKYKNETLDKVYREKKVHDEWVASSKANIESTRKEHEKALGDIRAKAEELNRQIAAARAAEQAAKAAAAAVAETDRKLREKADKIYETIKSIIAG